MVRDSSTKAMGQSPKVSLRDSSKGCGWSGAMPRQGRHCSPSKCSYLA